MIGGTELLIILGVIVLFFGAAAIPKLARSIGKAKSELEKGLKEGMEEEIEEDKKNGDTENTEKQS